MHHGFGFPMARAGQVIGLLGGSFDPAHGGHAHITREALKRFGLDQVWWMVSPGNPLKTKGPAPMARRMAAARQVMMHPRVKITDIETRLGTRFTAATLKRLLQMYPGVRFVWLMGADNMAQFHLWPTDWPISICGINGNGFCPTCVSGCWPGLDSAFPRAHRLRLPGSKPVACAGAKRSDW